MNKLALLAELRALAEIAPSFDLWDPFSQIQQSWLGRVHALLAKWNMEEANAFRTAADVMGWNSSAPTVLPRFSESFIAR